MKCRYAIVSLFLSLLVFTGCYLPIRGRVIDAETNEPIEGAVVLAEWNEEEGLPGFSGTSVYKIVEAETDKRGKFFLTGTFYPLVNRPYLVIYKQGYVAWRNDLVFPQFTLRKDYDVWEHGREYKLERFKESYSREQHSSFMQSGINGANLEQTPKYYTGLKYESIAGRQERNKRDHGVTSE